jgi:hypothetical protein
VSSHISHRLLKQRVSVFLMRVSRDSRELGYIPKDLQGDP